LKKINHILVIFSSLALAIAKFGKGLKLQINWFINQQNTLLCYWWRYFKGETWMVLA